jgi:hypothetical protein
MSSTPFKDLLAAAAEAKYVVIPKDDYAVACRDCTATKASTGKDMLKLTCKVVVGPHKGATLPTNQTLTTDNPVATAMFFKFLKAFGIEDSDLEALPPREDGGPNMAAVANMLKGRIAIATVSIENWQDEDRNQIDRFKKPTPEQLAGIEEAITAGGGSMTDPLGTGAGASDPFANAGAAADPTAGKAAGDPF